MNYERKSMLATANILRYLLSAAVCLLAAIGSTLWTEGSDYHDDGIVEPYVAPTEHLEYVNDLDPSLVPTLQRS